MSKGPHAFILALLVWPTLLYAPGLSGTFHLDDRPNLGTLSEVESSGDHFWRSVLRPEMSFPGRPLAMLTFAVQAKDWPENPRAFKRVNLAIHVFNGLLVFWVFLILGRLMALPTRRTQWLGFVAALLWGTAPIHVSTVLYVVQRMNLLAGSFSLLGMVGFLLAREKLSHGRPGLGYGLMVSSLALAIPLGVLCKENAILLPCFLLVLEVTVLRSVSAPGSWKWARRVLLWLPFWLVVGGLLMEAATGGGYTNRTFSLFERLLSQARVLFHYLDAALLPATSKLGLYRDGFEVSRNWVQPALTWLSVGAVSLLFVSGILLRRRQPVLSLGILWFLAGHLLESTTLSLEIYFEHRNYLPLLGPFFCLAYSVVLARAQMPSKGISAAVIASVGLYGGFFSYELFKEARLWGDPLRLVAAKIEAFPRSARARYEAASWLVPQGQFETALSLISDEALPNASKAAALGMQVRLHCIDRQVPLPELEVLRAQLGTAVYDANLGTFFARTAEARRRGECPWLDANYLSSAAEAVLSNPRLRALWADALVWQAQLYALDGAYERAMERMGRAIEMKPRVELAVYRAEYALALGDIDRAWQYFAEAEDIVSARNWRYVGGEPRLDAYRRHIRSVTTLSLARNAP